MTGFLLAGIGERNIKGETNFLVVDSSNLNAFLNPLFIIFVFIEETSDKEVEEAFKRLIKIPNMAVILINQHVNYKSFFF